MSRSLIRGAAIAVPAAAIAARAARRVPEPPPFNYTSRVLYDRADGPITLSLVMPVFNERATLAASLKRLANAKFPFTWELIIVDDGSTDGAVDEIDPEAVQDPARVVVVNSARNRGKGAAIRLGFTLAQGDILGIQDADLEYDPEEIPILVQHILKGDADVVFGSREFGAHSSFSFWYVIGNRFMSFLASAIFNRYITDAYTCYKFFPKRYFERMGLQSEGFEIEAEMVGKLLHSGARVMELPISYSARGRQEGKKIKAADGWIGLKTLLRIRLLGN